jgi:hypothetical protein
MEYCKKEITNAPGTILVWLIPHESKFWAMTKWLVPNQKYNLEQEEKHWVFHC